MDTLKAGMNLIVGLIIGATALKIAKKTWEFASSDDQHLENKKGDQS